MSIRLDTAARYVCDRSDWRISNLPLQKILYLAQVEYAGSHNGERLIDTPFEAWDYGPVAPNLYYKIKMFGSESISDVFYDALRLRDNSERKRVLDIVCDKYLNIKPGKLVNITHWTRGAWAKRYEQGQRNIPISDNDIIEEFRNRRRFMPEWDAISSGC